MDWWVLKRLYVQLERIAERLSRKGEPQRRDAEYLIERPAPGDRQRDLRIMPYGEYLRTPEWQEKKWIALENAAYRCQVCNTPRNLNVHHRTYKRRGHELERDLTVLCEDCHRLFHEHGRLHPEDEFEGWLAYGL